MDALTRLRPLACQKGLNGNTLLIPGSLDEPFLPSTPSEGSTNSPFSTVQSLAAPAITHATAGVLHPASFLSKQPGPIQFAVSATGSCARQAPHASEVPLPTSMRQIHLDQLAPNVKPSGLAAQGVGLIRLSAGPNPGVLSPAFLVSSLPQSPVNADGGGSTPISSPSRRGDAAGSAGGIPAAGTHSARLQRDVRRSCSLMPSSGGAGSRRESAMQDPPTSEGGMDADGMSTLSQRLAGLQPPTPVPGQEELTPAVACFVSPVRKKYSRFAGPQQRLDLDPSGGGSGCLPDDLPQPAPVVPSRFSSPGRKHPRGLSTDGGVAILRVDSGLGLDAAPACRASLLGSSATSNSPRATWVPQQQQQQQQLQGPRLVGASPVTVLPVVGFFPGVAAQSGAAAGGPPGVGGLAGPGSYQMEGAWLCS